MSKGRSNNSYIKKLKAEKKKKKKEAKVKKLRERKKETRDGSLENMIAYVDEHGNITSEPPEDQDDSSNNK